MLRNQHQYGHDYHQKCDERRGIDGPRTQTKTRCTGVGAKRQNVLWSIVTVIRKREIKTNCDDSW